MAHLAKLSALTDELVELITSTSTKNDRQRYNVLRESSLRSLRHHTLLRTNQFDVENQLNGLEERFRVQHREALADALRQRLNALAQVETKWHPDILHFLLELADKPLQKTNLEDLDRLKEPEEDPGPPLTWRDIAREDGWHQEPDIWRTIHYSDSSDDEYQAVLSEASDSDESEETSLWAHDSQHGLRPEHFQVDTADLAALDAVKESQRWRLPESQPQIKGSARKIPVTEFQLAREVLFMLQGLPTSLFQQNGDPNSAYQMAHIAWDTYRAMISWFSEAGRPLSILRVFTRKELSLPLLQIFNDNVTARLHAFDEHISAIQARLVDAQENTVVSLISIQAQLRPLLDPLDALSKIVQQYQETSNVGAFRYLELLYREVGASQASGRMETYEFLGRIFFACFQVYLRPIRLWMEEGQLIPGDRIFFVSDSSAEVPLNRIWQDQFKLRQTSTGTLHVPNFLQPSSAKIFTAGKSIIVLKNLGQFESSRTQWRKPEPALTFDVVCPRELDLAPFSELFSSAFDGWMQSKHHATSKALKQVLFETCHLEASIDTLEVLYFMSDGAVTDTFCSNIFGKMDKLRTDWRDRYFLAGLAQESFAPALDDSTLVSATVTSEGQRTAPTRARDSVRTVLPTVRVHYRFTWPIQLVVTDECLGRYHAIFTFLLQIRRATSLLNKKASWLDSRGLDPDSLPETAAYHGLRARLLWFCNCLHTYLATLILAPGAEKLRHQLREAHDVDGMIAVHLALTKQMTDAACLGTKLEPIRDGMLDVLDLAIRLEHAKNRKVAQDAEEMQELSRLSVMSSPMKGASPGRARPTRWARDSDGEDDENTDDEQTGGVGGSSHHWMEKSFGQALGEMAAEYARHLRFISGGLRGVARASGEEAAGKWDMLAEMLETGVKEER